MTPTITQILLIIVWIIAVVTFAVINLLVKKQMQGVSSLRPFSRVMYFVQLMAGIFFLLLALMFIINFGGQGTGTASNGNRGTIIY